MLPLISHRGDRLFQNAYVIKLTVLATIYLSGCTRTGNFLGQQGFTLPKSTVVIAVNNEGLLADRQFLKATLTSAQAVILEKEFKKQRPSQAFGEPVQPKDIPPLSDAAWTPKTIKRYKSGSFAVGDGKYPYHCMYVFDTSNSDKFNLYFYAWCPYN